jgi:hypothetical protein
LLRFARNDELVSLSEIPISDIGRGSMIAGQKRMKLFALAAAPAPGENLRNSMRRNSTIRVIGDRGWSRGPKICDAAAARLRLNMTRAPRGLLCAMSLHCRAETTRLLTCELHCSGREGC